MGTARRLGAFVMMAVGLTACAPRPMDPRLHAQVRRDLPESGNGIVRVRFLGVQGFVIQRNEDRVVTAPLYSNPALDDVLSDKKIEPNKAVVRAFLPREWVSGATAILVGHSHYDHLMDVPLIAHELAPEARVVGSVTARDLVASLGASDGDYFVDPQRVIAVNDAAQDGGDGVDYRSCLRRPREGCIHGSGEGRWFPVGPRVRIRALCSRHSPQFLRANTAWPGCKAPLSGPPQRASHWALGDTFAYLIDFLEDGVPLYRVYFQDSPTDREFGHVPSELLAEKRVDLALLTAGAFDQVDDFPESIITTLDPRYVLLGHWEDFFRIPSRRMRALWMFDFVDLTDRLDRLRGPFARPRRWEGEYWFPAPGQLFVFPVGEPVNDTQGPR